MRNAPKKVATTSTVDKSAFKLNWGRRVTASAAPSGKRGQWKDAPRRFWCRSGTEIGGAWASFSRFEETVRLFVVDTMRGWKKTHTKRPCTTAKKATRLEPAAGVAACYWRLSGVRSSSRRSTIVPLVLGWRHGLFSSRSAHSNSLRVSGPNAYHTQCKRGRGARPSPWPCRPPLGQ